MPAIRVKCKICGEEFWCYDNIPTKPTDSFWQPELDIQKSYCRCCGRARNLVQIDTKIK